MFGVHSCVFLTRGAAQQSCVCPGPLPRAGAQLPVDCVLVLGGWLVLLRGCDACRAVGGGLQSGASLIDVRLDVGSLPPRSSWPTVAGCLLGGFPVGRDWWGGERIVGGVLPRISVGTWGLCRARLCLVLVCGGRYGKILFQNGGINLLWPDCGCQMQSETGHGLPGLAPGRY